MRTLTAFYDDRGEAERAKEQLEGMGVSDVRITAQENDRSGGATEGHKGFMETLRDIFMPDEDRTAYSEGLHRGGSLLTARVDDAQVDQVCDLLDQSGAVDFDERQQQWRSDGWSGANAQDERSPTIPIAEEQLRVGKREVERGGVRVRSYVEETPVSEQVNLREERVEVERHPVEARIPGDQAEHLFQEREIKMRERGEEPVVGKEAVVTEEVGLRKEASERTETVEDTVRRTRVDVDDATGERRSFRADGSDGATGTPDDLNETEDARRLRLEREAARPNDQI
jgi:uncharacterized protein (TIGR02271 family)